MTSTDAAPHAASHPPTPATPIAPTGLSRLTCAAARASARRPRTAIALWIVLIVACIAAGSITGTRSLSDSAQGTGPSAKADARQHAAGLDGPDVESVLVSSSSARTTARAAGELARSARALPSVTLVQMPPLTTDGGTKALLHVALANSTNQNADGDVIPLENAASALTRTHPGVSAQVTGNAAIDNAITQVVDRDLHQAEIVSLPITLLILVIAFGAIAAACVPLLLGLTSVAAALGALGVVSQFVPDGGSTAPVVVLIGLAVGVDYSLFYIRRERAERRAGRGGPAALEAAAATVGRAVLVAGLTVMIALAGLLFTGLGVFTSMAIGAMVVVCIAVIGSLTVLPGVLALLGDRVNKGRLPGRNPGRSKRRLTRALARTVTDHPVAALLVSTAALAALAIPVLSMKTAEPGVHDLPQSSPAIVALNAVDRAFPGAPDDATIVVTGQHLDAGAARTRLAALGARAEHVTGGIGPTPVQVAGNGETAIVNVPMPVRGVTEANATVRTVRSQVLPTAARIAPHAEALLTGDAAGSYDFTQRLSTVTPLVIGFVLGLAFLLLVAAFGSPWLAVSVIALNLLSVGAAFGVLVSVFQHHWAQSLLHFTSDGAVVDWLPLFAFVVLFGLSMDYTVLVLERVREARRDGAGPREAAAEALVETAGAVTSAAAVMVGVFSVFATLGLLEFRQLGVGLAAAIALDATIVRAIALPALITLLGQRGLRPRTQARHARALVRS